MKGLIDFLLKVGQLKSVERSGWVREGMPKPETVAEHSWRVAILALTMAKTLDADTDELVKMALVHDLEEIKTFDPVTQRGKKQVGKHETEKETEIIIEMLENVPNDNEIAQLWLDHVPENTPGAPRNSVLLYELGKVATVWQALEYELAGEDPKKLDEFWENAYTHVKEPEILDLLNGLKKLRK